MTALACPIRARAILALAILAAAPAFAAGDRAAALENPAIDMPGYLADAQAASRLRAERRVTEAEFLALRADPGTIVLDARSADRYALLHVAGAISLPFTDLTADALAARVPGHDTRLLIYCNNNFSGAPDPFPRKMSRASLNLSTFIALYTYGYRNVYELGPLVDVARTDLPLESFVAADPGLAAMSQPAQNGTRP